MFELFFIFHKNFALQKKYKNHEIMNHELH